MSGVLAIDVSNARTALALWDDDGSVRHWRVASDVSRTPDEYHVLLTHLLGRGALTPGDVQGCVLGCVVPELAGTMTEVCQRLFGMTPLVVGPGVHTGLRIETDSAREVGADRIANAVAASARFGCPVLVLDFGTALTVDVVGADGAYVGAIIAPGVDVAAEGLARRAARLGRIDLVAPPRVIANNTVQALQSGLVYGYLGLIEGLVARARVEIGPARVVATGDAPWLRDLLAHTDVVDAFEPLLTLDGLRRIHAHHRAREHQDRLL
jgi:type III pantothenate kinase